MQRPPAWARTTRAVSADTGSERPLHVCHLGKYYPPASGGIETHVRTLAQAQARAGASVRVVCINHANRSGRDVTWSRYGSTGTVHEQDGPVRVTRLGRSASVARFDVCPDLGATIGALSDQTVDVLHLHTPNPTMLLALTRLRAAPVVVITHHSDIVRQRLLRQVLSPFERVVYSRAACLLASSEAYIGGSGLLSAYRQKVQVLPLGLDLQAFADPSDLVKARAAGMRARYPGPIWLAVGRCVYYKGLETAVEALSSVPGTLIVIGRGPLEEKLRHLADRHGVSDRIVWRREADQDELVAAYHAAAALWFPSNARSEAFGLVQVEAMASGCPVINTAIPDSGVPWVSVHGRSGLTVRMDDPRALAAAAMRIWREPGLRQRLAEGGRARAAAEFDDGKMAARCIEIYQQLLERRRIANEGGHARLRLWIRRAADEVSASVAVARPA